MKKTLKLDFYKISDELLQEYQDHLEKYGLNLSDVIERFILTIVKGKAQELATDWQYGKSRELALQLFKEVVLDDFPSAVSAGYKDFESDTYPYNKEFDSLWKKALEKYVP